MITNNGIAASLDLEIINKKIKPKPTIVYETYWKFAAERQNIFFRRLKEGWPPWTADPILKLHKFTNAYRVTDRVSQYLVKEVIYKGDQNPAELFFRILLFKLFNKIETWELIKNSVDEIRFDTYSFKHYDQILQRAKTKGIAIYSGAYIMASGQTTFGYELKHQNHLCLIELMLKDRLYEKIQDFENMEALYNALLRYPTIGNFLAYQLATDINYSNLTDFSEMEFTRAGPGAKDGIRKCFADTGDYSEEDIIKMMADKQFEEFGKLEIEFKDLWGRPLQLIDCQNIFCEVDKYSRLAHPEISGISNRKRIKQKFNPSSLKPMNYLLPEKWRVKIKDM
jgi:hypothetical protein